MFTICICMMPSLFSRLLHRSFLSTIHLSGQNKRCLSASTNYLSGHNKWSKIKTKKGLEDARKSQMYSKASRDIIVAARSGGSMDPEKNATLGAVLRTAKMSGVPKDNIERALAKASGKKGKRGELITYEALAHGVVGVIIECLTDNKVRTISNLREILKDHGAQFASVTFQFQRKGYVKVALARGHDFDERMEHLIERALEASADDFGEVDSSRDPAEIEFTCPPDTLATLTSVVASPELSRELLSSELIYMPLLQDSGPPDEMIAAKITDLVYALEEYEDTLRVWTTLDT